MMLDLIELAVAIGKYKGVIPVEIVGSLLLIIAGIKGYVGTKDGSDIVELLVYAGSIAFIAIGVVGFLTVAIQLLAG